MSYTGNNVNPAIISPGYNPTPQGRLTLQTATPVMSTTQSAKTTIYYTPYVGNQITLYNGTSSYFTSFSELSVLTTDTTKNPAAIGVSKVNDWFVWNDNGTLRLSHGPDWTNDTTRSAGTVLVMVNGILLNSVAITNGPGASRGTYVGTTRSNGSSQLDWIIGGSGSGGVAGFLGIWNMYNRIEIVARSIDTGVTYTYSAASHRQARASSGNQISIVTGLAEDTISMMAQTESATVASNGYLSTSFGYSSTAPLGKPALILLSASNARLTTYPSYVADPILGFNTIYRNEASDGSNNNRFNENSLDALSISLKM